MTNNSSAFGLTARNRELYSRMRTDKQRIAKYKAKTDPVIVRRKIAAMLPIMKANHAAFAREAVALETAFRDWWFAREQVAPSDRILYIFYLDFARQLWNHKKKYSGANLVLMAQSKKDQWLALGLDDRVLRKLALDVFGIVLA
jgi:hypothetical protein